MRVNLYGTRAFIHHCQAYGVKQAIFVGRHTYYGAAADSPLYHTEDEPPMSAHSFHPSPFMLTSKIAFPDGHERFTERNCARGYLGNIRSLDAMPLMMGHAGKLAKFGA